MSRQRVHVRVTGRVQGVYYRASTQQQAATLGLVGWVRNLPDGDVEFEAEGPQGQIEALLQWARKGPAQAHVEDLKITHLDIQSAEAEFAVLR